MLFASTTQSYLDCIFLTVTKEKLNMNVGIVYRHPNSNLNDFLTELRSIIKTLPKTVTYLMGDFNFDLHKSESSSNVEAFEQFLISVGLFPVISLATHHNPSAKNKSCIDKIFTNRVETVNQSGVVVNCGTAHSTIFSTSKFNYNLKPTI